MRIAIWHNLPSGGGKRALYAQVQGLLARGHVVEAWCSSHADQSYLPLNRLIPEHVRPIPPIDLYGPPPGHRWQRLLHPYRLSEAIRRVMLAHAQQCAAEITAGGFEVVLAHPCMYQRVPAIGRFLALPRVLYLQEPDRQLYEADPDLPWVAPDLPAHFWRSPPHVRVWAQDAVRLHTLRRKALAEVTNVRAFNRVLVNSLFSRESLLRAYGLEATVCYLGVDTGHFRPTGATREQFVISLGALHPTKRVEHAIQAIGTMAVAMRPELVWIANFVNPGYYQQMQALARACQVRFTALVGISDEALVDWLNRAAVMIYTPRLEPFGLAPLEANACATPVVALAEGGVRETITTEVNGLLVESNEPAALGAAVQRVLANPAWAQALGAAGRQRVLERWQWSDSIVRLEREMFSVIEASGRRAKILP